MAFNSSGVYSQISGAITAAAGQILQSAVWNNIHTDLGNALSAMGACNVTAPNPRNLFYFNGGMEIWQRSAGGSASIAVAASSTVYTADRAYLATGANQACTVSQQAGLTSGSQYCAQVQRNSGQTGTTGLIFGIPFDLNETVRMRGVKPSLSFQVATGANWSPAGGTLVATLYVGSGTVQKAGAAAANFTNPVTVIQLSTNLAQSASAAMVSGITASTVPVNATQAELQFTWTPAGTAGANDWFQVDDIMIDVSAAPAQGLIANYERTPFTVDLQECRRHFWKTFAYGTAPAQNIGVNTGELTGMAGKAGALAEFLPWRNPVQMRTTPGTVTLYNPANTNAQVNDETLSGDCSSSTTAGVTAEAGVVTATGSTTSTGTAAGNRLGVHITVDAGI